MPGNDFLTALKAAWRSAHDLLNPLVMNEARHIQATEDLAAGLSLLKQSAGRSL